MEQNVGGLDRFFRFGLGFLSLAVAIASEDTLLRLIFGGVAAFGLGTAALGHCPLNARFGIDTRGKKSG